MLLRLLDVYDAALERTDVIYGEDNTTKVTLQFAQNASKSIDCCLDSVALTVAAGFEPFKKAIIDARQRGIRLRYITKITKENIAYCREFAGLVELRHLDVVKGNFAVNEKESIFSAITMQEAKPVPKAVYSNIRELVEQQQAFFETLWNKSIPAKERIREIEQGTVRIQTRVADDPDQILTEMIRINEESKKISVCADAGGMEFGYNHLLDVMKTLMEKEIKGEHQGIRYATYIDKSNLEIAKTLLNLGVKMRHIKNVPALGFGVSDKEIAATLDKVEGNKVIGSLLVSNEPLYVAHLESFFEQMWKSGFDARTRIRQIEQGVEAATMELVSFQASIEHGTRIMKSAKEILVIFSSADVFGRAVKTFGVAEMYKMAVKKNNAKIRILVPASQNNNNIVEDVVNQVKDKVPEVEVRVSDRALETNLSMMVADGKELLIWEELNNNNTTTTSNRNDRHAIADDYYSDLTTTALGMVAYSNSKSLVSSYAVIFENLWKQADLYERLKAHDLMQREFINIAAHELRTPVQPILGMTEIIESSMNQDAEAVKVARDDWAIIRRNAKRLERLTSDILELSRIESSSLVLNREEFDLNQLVKDIIEDAKRQVHDTNARIEFISLVVNDDSVLFADKGRITEVMQNLLDNAIKFTQKGKIMISLDKKDNEVIVTVTDTGTGIHSAMLPRLFTKFATKSEKGTGLGLYISKGIVEAHGGKIWAKNNDDGNNEEEEEEEQQEGRTRRMGGGTTFTFTLPIERDQ